MAISYDYFKNPPREGEEGKPLLHPRPVITGTMKIEDLANVISARSSFSSADLKGMLDNLAEMIFHGLSHSENVYLEGIGTFSLSLTSRPVKDKKEIREDSIRVKDIHFRADKKLKQRFRRVRFTRVKSTGKRMDFTKEQRFYRIHWYIDRYESINISTVMQINHCSHKKAHTDIATMIERGEIIQKRIGHFVVYTK